VKLVTALVSTASFETIREALALFGVRGMTVDQVHLVTGERGQIQIYRGQHFTIDAQPTIKMDLVVPEDELSDVTRIIGKIVASDDRNGAVWVSQIDLLVRVRTGEYGIDAL
jgi:nitrogen regulatory protein PII